MLTKHWLVHEPAGPHLEDFMSDMAIAPSKETVECVSSLIGFDTVSRNSNLLLIEWAAEKLRAAGASLRFDYNADRSKANLFATFGEGPGGIVFSGHTDVVPVDGQHWSSDPFRADLREGQLFGRGACDMKGFIGATLAQASLFGRSNLREPVHLALSYDEEAGCLGIPGLLADMRDAGIKPNGCIVGEPTEMRVVAAHKGGRIYRCKLTGCAAHSSLTPKGVNAIEYASRLIARIQDLADEERESGHRIEDFDVPFSTISTNTIAGGNGQNIVPAECEFSFEYRFLPGVDPDRFISTIESYAMERVLPRMKAQSNAAAIEFECIGNIPALDADENKELQRLAGALLGNSRPKKVAYGTEASFFQTAGVPSIVCGPGSINNAHKADEFVSLEQLALCERFIKQVVATLTI
jgi:acetylornithine deacetylase